MQTRRIPQPVQLLCVAASSDTDLVLLAQWDRHLRPFEQAGLVTVWSGQRLLPGADWRVELSTHLKDADVVVFLLSADFFDDNLCLALMNDALLRQQQESVRLVPLLTRPVAWQESPLGRFAHLPGSGDAISTWQSPDEGWRQSVAELARLLELPLHAHPLLPSPRARTERDRMLRRLRLRYEQMLGQSLQGAVQIELGLASRPVAIRNAVSLSLRLPDQPDQLLPPHTSIMDAYEQAHQELLILGEPGAGKSTLLLELAHHLLQQAEQDVTHPLPIVLPLSSWANRRPPLQEWLIEHVTAFYDVSRKLSQQWVQADLVLPLLDGLDEMEASARPACVAAINAYHREHLLPIVICSRTNEYNLATIHERLALHTAVVVQPLSAEHVDAHLALLGQPLATLRTALAKNTALAELTTTPLWLYVLLLIAQTTNTQHLAQQPDQLQHQIWTTYVQEMVRRKGDRHRYPLRQTLIWLSFLAQQTRMHNQTIFSLEDLQPDWLPGNQQWVFRWSMVLFMGLLCSLLLGLLLGLTVGEISGPLIGFTSGLLVGLFGRQKGQGEPAERQALAWKRLGLGFIGLVFGLLIGAAGGLISGLVGGLVGSGLTIMVNEESTRSPSTDHEWSSRGEHFEHLTVNELLTLYRRVKKAGREIFRVSTLLVFTLIIVLGTQMHSRQISGLDDELIFGFVSGVLVGFASQWLVELRAVVQHYTLRFWLWQSGLFPWKAISFLEDATACNLLQGFDEEYSFMHRLLLDYFADLDTAAPSTSPAGQSPL